VCLFYVKRGETPSLGERVSPFSIEKRQLLLYKGERVSLFYIERRERLLPHKGKKLSLFYVERRHTPSL